MEEHSLGKEAQACAGAPGSEAGPTLDMCPPFTLGKPNPVGEDRLVPEGRRGAAGGGWEVQGEVAFE